MNAEDDTLPATPDSLPPSRSSDIPATIGRFEIEEKLGQGGMGVVLLAKDPTLGRRIAIKVLRGGAVSDSAKQRLLREAQGTAKLSHENVIVVHEVGTHGDQIYLAMEYVAGETLRKRQARRTWREIVALYTRAGRGLQAAHDAGLVHRDFKPDNVLVGRDGRLRVTDFGLVAATGALPEAPMESGRGESALASTLTHTGAVMGTPRYMAPEQHLGESVDARADQFAFCVALYEALYGRAPFAGTTYAELSDRVVNSAPAPPPASNVPTEVRDAVLRGLSRDRNDRHRSMTDLLALLAVDSPTTPRKRWPLAVGASAVVIAIAIVAIMLGRRSNDTTPPPASLVVNAPTSKLDVTALRPAMMAFDTGHYHFKQKNYDAAATEFQKAYDALKVPQIQYSLAASLYMKAKRDGDAALYRRAAELYTRYLESDPIAPGVAGSIDVIEGEVARLEAGGDHSTTSAIQQLADPEVRGFVIVISEPPGATVYLDAPAKGPVGITPWSGSLDGEHELFIAMPGYKLYERSSIFDSHKMVVIQAALSPIEKPGGLR